MHRQVLLLSLALFVLCAVTHRAPQRVIRVSCVGDSITQGGCNTKHPYPEQLQGILGSGYKVSNFGNSGKTMLKKGLCFASGGDCSYWNQPTWPAVLASEPDIVTIMLGTNDAKEFNWFGVQSQGDYYVSDYYDMIRKIHALPSKPKIYLMIPPPLYPPFPFQMNKTVINEIFPVIIPKIGRDAGAEPQMIDIFNALGGADLKFPKLFCDGCHPVDAGYEVIAKTIAKVITEAYD